MAWCDIVKPRTLRECRIALGKSQGGTTVGEAAKRSNSLTG